MRDVAWPHRLARLRGRVDLTRLGHDLDKAWAIYTQAFAQSRDIGGDDNDRLCDEAEERCGAIVEQIETLTATTLNGLRVKALACSWCRDGRPFNDTAFNNHGSADARLASAVLRDLLAIGPERLGTPTQASARKSEPDEEPVDWSNPPPGFVPHPAADPQGFLNIRAALRHEAERLHWIAVAEFNRRAAKIDGDMPQEDRAGHLDRLRRSLRLDELAAAAAPEPATTALTNRMLSCWREWAVVCGDVESGSGAEAAAERMLDQRNALIEEADALPATLDALLPKALSVAWMAYVEEWTNGQARDEYDVHGRLTLDVDTAICGRVLTEYPARG